MDTDTERGASHRWKNGQCDTPLCFVVRFMLNRPLETGYIRCTQAEFALTLNEVDAAFEERFEEACRDYVEYAKTSGYSNEHDMYFSEYTFEFTDLFEEE